MKCTNLILIAVVASLLLTACGPKDTPEIAAKEWTEAFLNFDSNGMAERTCSSGQFLVQSATIVVSAAVTLARLTGQQIQGDISGLQFETVSKNDESAQVRVHGESRITVSGTTETAQFDTIYAMVEEDGKWKWCGSALPTMK